MTDFAGLVLSWVAKVGQSEGGKLRHQTTTVPAPNEAGTSWPANGVDLLRLITTFMGTSAETLMNPGLPALSDAGFPGRW